MSLSQISSELDDFFLISSQLPYPPGFRLLCRDSIGIIMLLMQFMMDAFNVAVVVSIDHSYQGCTSWTGLEVFLEYITRMDPSYDRPQHR